MTVSGSALTVDFGPTTTLVGNTSFVSSISGGASPYTCSWSFGDGTPSQMGCNSVHDYVSSGSFTAMLTVTDSQNTVRSVTHAVSVQGAPTISKLLFSHNVKSIGGTGTQTYTITVSNPSSLSVDLKVALNVCNSTGGCSTITQTATVGPSSTITMTATLTDPPDKYTFSAALTYSAKPSIPGGTTTVVGNGNTVTGKFSIS